MIFSDPGSSFDWLLLHVRLSVSIYPCARFIPTMSQDNYAVLVYDSAVGEDRNVPVAEVDQWLLPYGMGAGLFVCYCSGFILYYFRLVWGLVGAASWFVRDCLARSWLGR